MSLSGLTQHLRSNVVAYMALFVALGGSSYAAIRLPKNSVSAKQIRKAAVTAPKIKAGAVDSGKVKDRSLTSVDFAAGQLPAGEQGPQGAQGQQGAQGPQGEAGTARAYAFVNPTCPGDVCAFTKSKNITSVRRQTTGTYCITAAAGIDPTASAYIAGVDLRNTSGAEGTTSAMAAATSSPPCNANEFEVNTQRIDFGLSTSNPVNDVAFVVSIF